MNESMTILVLQDVADPRYVEMHGPSGEPRACCAAMLPTVVGSNCIRALSGNPHARHHEDWPSPELQRRLAQIKAESGEYPKVL